MVLLPCGRCCTTCSCPAGEKLPASVSVSFSGLTKSAVKLDGPLLSVEFQSCFGEGASASVSGTGGLPNEGGPVTGVTLESGGSGYAVLGRAAPASLSLSGSGGGAEFQVTLVPSTDECDRPLWSISSVKVKSGGAGYQNDEQLTVSPGDGEFQVSPAEIRIETQPQPPSLTASADSQAEPATFSVTTQQISSDPQRWGVGNIAVVDNAAGFFEGQALTITAGEGDTVVSHAVAYIWVKHIQPQVEADYFGSGSGATFSASLEKFTEGGRDYWRVSSAVVTSPGSGYTTGQNIFFWNSSGFGNTVSTSAWAITADQQTGAVTSIAKLSAGKFYGVDGTIDKVIVESQGSYYGRSTVVESAAVVSGGAYYKEDASLPPIVADVTATITQLPPSDGSGAVLSVVVNDTVGDPLFGQVTSLTLEESGNGYLIWSWNIYDCNVAALNGKTFVIRRSTPTQRLNRLVSFSVASCLGSGAGGAAVAEGGAPDSGGFPITRLTLTNGGSGYARLGRVEPQGITLTPQPPPGVNPVPQYGGAAFAVSLSQKHGDCGLPYWEISDISVTQPGSGYTNGQPIQITAGNGNTQQSQATATIQAVDGEVQGVTVVSKGRFYRESVAAQPYVIEPQVVFQQSPPSNGIGAEAAAIVDANTTSPTFGQIIAVSLLNGGGGYMGWSWIETCLFQECIANNYVTVEYKGASTPPTVSITPRIDPYVSDLGACDIFFEASNEAAPFRCDPLGFIATELLGGTATVSRYTDGNEITCQRFMEADSITVTLDASDYEVIVQGQLTPAAASIMQGCPSTVNGKYFARLSGASGTFSLSPVWGTQTARYFEYEIGYLCGFRHAIGCYVTDNRITVSVTIGEQYEIITAGPTYSKGVCDPWPADPCRFHAWSLPSCSMSVGTWCGCDTSVIVGDAGRMRACTGSSDAVSPWHGLTSVLSFENSSTLVLGSATRTESGSPYITVKSIAPG